MHSGPSGTPSKPFAPDLSLKDLADSKLSDHSIPEPNKSQPRRRALNPTLSRKCVRVRLAGQDGDSHPMRAVIPSGGVLAGVEESRLRDPSTHFVRSG